MRKRSGRALAWWIAAAMTAVMMLAVLGFADVRFATNDDAPILRAFMGYEAGTPAQIHMYIHGLLAVPLGWLGRMAPHVPWYSWMQLSLMALALTVIGKSLMQLFLMHGKPLWLGALFALAVYAGFGVEYTAVFTFTQTAAFLGAAAVLQLMSTDCSNGKTIVLSHAGAAVLCALAYALRQSALLPVLAFCALAFIGLVWKHRPAVKPVLASLCAVVVILGGVFGWRQAELNAPSMRDYLDWHDANGYIIDYYGLGALTQEEIDLAGWSDETLALGYEWCFLDSDLDAESFRRVTEALEQKEQPPLTERLREAKRLFIKRASGSQYEYRMLLGAAGLAMLGCAAGMLLARGKRLRLLFTLCALAAGSGLMILYLAMQGRVPLRAVLVIALPAVCMLLGLLPEGRIPTAALCVLAALMIGISAMHLDDVKGLLWKDIRGASAADTAFTDAESCALLHPEALFILHGGVSGDLNAFPDYTNGMPHNVTFWGHWGMRSPENAALFERFGIDIWRFDPAHLLRDDVFFVVPDGAGPGVLLDWLQAKIGPQVRWEAVQTHGRVSILRFLAE